MDIHKRRVAWGAAIPVIVCWLAAGALAQRSDSVGAACRRQLARAQATGVTAGFLAVDVADGSELASWHADRLLIPASNQKIVTTGAALLALGADHEIYTDLMAHGERRGGVLDGSLRVRGEGDPTLESDKVIPLLVEKVREAGIRRVLGDLLVDDRLFDREFIGPAWPGDRPSRSWMAEVAALSLDAGQLRVEITAAARAGSPARVRVVPEGSGWRLVGKVGTTRSRKSHVIHADRGAEPGTLRVGGRAFTGTRSQRVGVSIHDAPLAFGHALAHALRKAGIPIEGDVRRPLGSELESGGHLLARFATPIGDVIPAIMKKSHNHSAEMLFKHLGAVLAGEGSFRGGDRAVRRAFAEAGGIDLGDVVIADGSGLSRNDRLSARCLVSILKCLWHSEHREVFDAACPSGGEPGTTLRRRFGSLGKRVRAKTGTLRDAVALSGYVETEDGRTVAFSILLNVGERGRTGALRSLQHRLVGVLAESGQER